MVEIRAPLAVNIDITDRCNLRCSYCYNSWNLKRATDIDVEVCINLINDLFEKHGIFHLTIAGGEPLLHPQIFEILERCFVKYHPRIVLLSNGTPLLKEKTFQKFKKVCYFLDSKGSRLNMQISLDSHLPSVHDLQRNRGQDVLDSIEKALQLPIDLQLACVVTKNNIEVADQIVEKFYPRVKNFHYMNIMPSAGRSGGDYFWRMAPSEEEITRFHNRILKLEKIFQPIRISKIKRDCEIGLQGGSIRGKGCLAGTTRIEIDPVLNVRACCMSTETLGNLTEMQFEQMWTSEKAEFIRNQEEPYCLVWRNRDNEVVRNIDPIRTLSVK